MRKLTLTRFTSEIHVESIMEYMPFVSPCKVYTNNCELCVFA